MIWMIFYKVHSAETLLHLCDSKWAPWSLKSLATHMFVEQPVQVNIKENTKASHYWFLVSGFHQMTGGFPSQKATKAESISMCSCLHGSPTRAGFAVYLTGQNPWIILGMAQQMRESITI